MHSFVTYTLLASASLVAAIDPRFEFPDTVPALLKRQAPGTPQYACHEDCGLLITLGRNDGYCDSDEWNERYGRCMNCANTYKIWQYYRDGVTSAAEKCDLSSTPNPSGSESSGSTAEEEKPSSTGAVQPSTTKAQDPVTTEADAEEEEQTTEASRPSTTAAAEETDASSETTNIPETEAASEESSGASKPSAAATTLTTAATPAAESTDAASAATKTSVGEISTTGVTATPAPTTVIVNAGAKHFGLATAVTVAALAILGLS